LLDHPITKKAMYLESFKATEYLEQHQKARTSLNFTGVYQKENSTLVARFN